MARPLAIPRWWLSTLLAALVGTTAEAATIDPTLVEWLQTAKVGGEIPVIVSLANMVSLETPQEPDRPRRRAALLRRLREAAEQRLAPLQRHAETAGGRQVRVLWAAHAVALSAGPDLIRDLAAWPDIESIRRDVTMRVMPSQSRGHLVRPARNGRAPRRQPPPGSEKPARVGDAADRAALAHAASVSSESAAPPEWNLTAVKCPDLWRLGFTGRGIVVASLDTGADGDHPDLAAQYRGGAGSWYDPHGEHDTPADVDGHGTHALSLLVGRANGGSAIGLAPDAQWIAAKLFNDAGMSRESILHEGLQWALDPDGDPSTDDAPDIVNLSWTVDSIDRCNRAFQHEWDVFRASGIAVIMAAGNSGPGVSTSVSPANNPGQLSVGSVDRQRRVSTFSSRGPSACDGGVFPAVMAPGEQVLAADLSFGGMPNYAAVTGTSFAAPHVAGVMALLMSAVPTAPLSLLEAAVKATAQPVLADDAWHPSAPGLVDAMAAYRAVMAAVGKPSNRPMSEQ